MDKGLLEIYTGDGKGKTTAAVGLGIRAAGRGMKVVMIQFLKGGDTGELMFLGDRFENFRIHRFKSTEKFITSMSGTELDELKTISMKGLALAREIMESRKCDILILDEFFGLINHGIADINYALDIAMARPDTMELVLTGRDAPAEFIEIADLVSEIQCVKHPYDEGVEARTGIER
jgi:cob(I)alamin adenosyltransferase